jgi:hypothetical protein
VTQLASPPAPAPAAAHDLLDALWPAVSQFNRMGMWAQVIIHIEKDGKAGRPKITGGG